MISELTERERDVLRAILAGHTKGEEIANHLYLCRQTVYTYLNGLFYKTGARNKTDLVLWAWRNGWHLEQQQ